MDGSENRDCGLFTVLFEQYREPFTRFANSFVRDRAVSENLFVDALVDYWQRRGELDFRISSLEDFTTQSLFSSEIHEIVRQTLAEMPAQTRRIFEMSRFENRRNTEIAAELNLSIKTVEFHIGKVLKVLRVRLKDYLLFFFVFILR